MFPVRNSDPATSHEAAEAVGPLAAKLRARIVALAQTVGKVGLTSNEAERQILDHKANSVSPRFAELVRSGHLVRVFVGNGKPTKRSPGGVARYAKRFDPQTKQNVQIHWRPEFAPCATKKPAASADQCEMFNEEVSGS